MEALSRHWAGVPPISSTAALAAMAEATPTSAWQPPTAPDTVAFRMARYPMALALYSAGRMAVREVVFL